ncbi:hypothetical protein MPNT_10324 [Candidatus Methylacidithermus pantelleriae]|uniref:Uncharacterized protein n=1 Tax=Candidatus Methylacidithermus pantelleriae TaxID=2744239 RepID=A0A8J2BLW5_9BACT|nr:hypothetical protein MPNT_10324 [Candidatus Methylacidithermus pantelleriae]
MEEGNPGLSPKTPPGEPKWERCWASEIACLRLLFDGPCVMTMF